MTPEAFCCTTGTGGGWTGWSTGSLGAAGPSGPDNDEAGLIRSDEAGGGPVGPDEVAGVAWEGGIDGSILCLTGGSGSKDQNVRELSESNEEFSSNSLLLDVS